MDSFQQLYESGKYNELVTLTSQFNTPETKYWHIRAKLELFDFESLSDEIHKLEISDPEWNARLLFNLGDKYLGAGYIDKGLTSFQASLNIYSDLNQTKETADTLNRIGMTYSFKGEIELALGNFEKGLKLAEEHDYKVLTSRIHNNIGELYRAIGELELAQTNYEKALNIAKDCNEFDFIVIFLNNIAEILTSKDKLSEARQYLVEGKQYLPKTKDVGIRSLLYASWVEVSVMLDNLTEAEEAVDQLEVMVNKYGKKIIQLHRDYGKALVYKSSNRLKFKVKAQELLETIINTSGIEFELMIKAMNHRIELLIYEYSAYEQDVVLVEIVKSIEQMYNLAKKQHRYATLIDVLIIQSRLAIIDNKFDQASLLLTQAELMAKEKQMEHYSKKVQTEIEILENNLSEIKRIIASKSISERLDQIELLDYIRRARKIGDTFGGKDHEN